MQSFLENPLWPIAVMVTSGIIASAVYYGGLDPAVLRARDCLTIKTSEAVQTECLRTIDTNAPEVIQ